MSNNPLNQDDAETKLGKLNVAWSLLGGSELERVFEFDDFKTALTFVNKVGELAEKQQHHPTIELEWGKVVVRTTTHDANGLTSKDFALADAIDELKA